MTDATAAYLEMCSRDPLYWRKTLYIKDKPWGTLMAGVQEADFKAIDPALKFLAGRSTEMPYVRKFWRMRSRGYSKSTDMASDILWTLAFSKRRLTGFVAAGDKDQARFIWDQISQLMFDNPWLNDLIKQQQNKVYGRTTDSMIEFISSDGATSFGATPDFVIMDELTHYPDTTKGRLFFDACLSSYFKTYDQGGVLSVGCNAGYGRSFHWNLHETARTSDDWYYSAPPGASPWYSEQMLESARKTLTSESEFQRLFCNQWMDSGSDYISLAEAEACIDPKLAPKKDSDQDVFAYVASLDYAEKKDRTVGVVAHRVGDKVIVDRMDVVQPTDFPDGVTPVKWCEDWLKEVYTSFGTGRDHYGRPRQLHVVLDKHQLLWLLQKWEYTVDNMVIYPFDFKSGNGNYELSVMLRNAILHKTVLWYPNCGAVSTDTGKRDDLCTELAALTVIERTGGKWRLDHNTGGHDDRAFALGAVVHYIFQKDASPLFED